MSKAMQLKAGIKNLAKNNRISAQAVLQNFMMERLLERISISRYKDMIILKGGMLISCWLGSPAEQRWIWMQRCGVGVLSWV